MNSASWLSKNKFKIENCLNSCLYDLKMAQLEDYAKVLSYDYKGMMYLISIKSNCLWFFPFQWLGPHLYLDEVDVALLNGCKWDHFCQQPPGRYARWPTCWPLGVLHWKGWLLDGNDQHPWIILCHVRSDFSWVGTLTYTWVRVKTEFQKTEYCKISGNLRYYYFLFKGERLIRLR